MPQAPIAVVAELLSGGMDSCVCAAIAAESHRLALLHSSYGQLTEEREHRAFEEIADHFQAPHRLRIEQRYMTAIGGSALTDRSLEVPKADLAAAQQGHVPITYVPFRNAHFLSAAVSWAEVLGAERIFVGAVEQDSSGYPDCRPAYYQAFSQVIERGTRPETKIDVRTPLIGCSKAEIVRRGVALGAPLHLTWSCYRTEDVACGICDSCVLRLQAFDEAREQDLIPYAARTSEA